MSKIAAAMLITLMLTACMPYAPSDPWTQKAQGEALIDAADAQIKATAQAAMLKAQEATMQAAVISDQATAQAGAMMLDLQRSQATSTAQSAQFTAQAQAHLATQAAQMARLSIKATEQAYTATQAALDVAIERQRQDAVRANRRAEFYASILPLFVVAALAVVVFFVIKIGNGLYGWMIEWQDRRNSIFTTADGVIFVNVLPDGSRAYTRLLQDNRTPLLDAAHNTDARWISNNVLEYPVQKRSAEPDGVTVLVGKLLVAAAAENGGDSQQIPGWRNLDGWNSDRWQRAVNALVKAGVVDTSPTGTYVAGEYRNINHLYAAIRARDVKVRPAP